MNKKLCKKSVIIGMSGGVDSSVTAAILKKQGYEVLGVFLRFWKEGSTEKNKREQEGTEGEKDASKVCEKLGIPFRIVDVRREFKNKLVKYFLKEYQAGRTPNPCVFCNEKIKFKALFDTAKKYGAEYVATGHYARLRREITNSIRQLADQIQNQKSKTIIKLLQAKDANKDQSYFLYRLKQKQLAKLLFPLGGYEKSEVRQLAKKFKLPVFDKVESQNICFLRDDDVKRFLGEKLKLKKGDISNQEGKTIGKHEGLPLYTIGQRKGINVGGTGPYYVISKDKKKNILRVTNVPNDPNLKSGEISLEKLTWISDRPKFPLEAFIKTRYRQKSVCGIIEKCKKGYFVKFAKPERAIASGQSAVFYSKKGEVLGGGIIKG